MSFYSEPFPKQKSLTDFFKPKLTPKPTEKPAKKEKHTFPDIPGLSLTENFISEAEEQHLWQEVNKLPWITDLKRRYQLHGYHYDNATKTMLEYLGEIPPCFTFLIDRIMEKGLMVDRPDQCGVNEYESGQGIGPHIDKLMFGHQVINISLGSDIVMDFYGPEEQKKSILLPRRSLLLVEGIARYEWKHGIALRKTDKLDNGMVVKRKKRISVTFRVANKHPIIQNNRPVNNSRE